MPVRAVTRGAGQTWSQARFPGTRIRRRGAGQTWSQPRFPGTRAGHRGARHCRAAARPSGRVGVRETEDAGQRCARHLVPRPAAGRHLLIACWAPRRRRPRSGRRRIVGHRRCRSAISGAQSDARGRPGYLAGPPLHPAAAAVRPGPCRCPAAGTGCPNLKRRADRAGHLNSRHRPGSAGRPGRHRRRGRAGHPDLPNRPGAADRPRAARRPGAAGRPRLHDRPSGQAGRPDPLPAAGRLGCPPWESPAWRDPPVVPGPSVDRRDRPGEPAARYWPLPRLARPASPPGPPVVRLPRPAGPAVPRSPLFPTTCDLLTKTCKAGQR